MKKLLIITHLKHQQSSNRIVSISKYLQEFGWEVTILSPKTDVKVPANVRLVETENYESEYGKIKLADKKYGKIRPYLRKIYKYYKEIKQYPDAEEEWIPLAYNDTVKIIEDNPIDAIISSSSPVSAHIIASMLKERFNIPWIADFRDLWTQNHCYPYSRVRKCFETRLEKKTLLDADVLTTVSETWKTRLRRLHGFDRRVFHISNGFDSDLAYSPLTKEFTITYTGQVYEGKQYVENIFKALSSLLENNVINREYIHLRFYGTQFSILLPLVKKYDMSDVTEMYEQIPKSEVLLRQAESQVLLYFNWEEEYEKGVIAGKLYEYLGSKRPILATGGYGNDEVQKILEQTKGGYYCSSLDRISLCLKELYLNYKLNGKVSYNGKQYEIMKYHYRDIAWQFVQLLDDIKND